jgi:hypothetical protein
VYCTIYRLRNFGEKLQPASVKATACHGQLMFDRHPLHRHTMRASVLGAKGVPAAQLDDAVVKRIGQDGLMVSGAEAIPGRNSFCQVWWCVPCTGEPSAGSDRIYQSLTSA